MTDVSPPEVVVVTGARAGIGAAIADRLAGQGKCLVCVDLAAPAQEGRPSVHWLAADVSEWPVHERVAQLASSLGVLTGWVNNAGIQVYASAEDITSADFHRQLAVNLGGVVAGCSAAVRAMLQQGSGGSIVNVSSVQAAAGFPGALAYQASKGGVDAVTRQVAVEYGYANIRCNAVRPGVIMTPLSRRELVQASQPQVLLDEWASLAPLGRIGEPAEVAAAVAYLLGEEASFISGVCLDVDGGLLARGCLPRDLRTRA